MNELASRLTAIARRAAKRLPAPIQSRLRQVVRRARGSSRPSVATPVLSVVIVARNAESDLGECLRSLQSQTLNKLEVIVVDNGSTDGTAAVAYQMAAQDRRFRVVLRPRLAPSAARNAGAQLARGQFLAFLDATDTVPRTAYASLINSLRHTGSDFAAGAVRVVVRGRRQRPSWTTVTHDRDRPAVTLQDFPRAIQDRGVTNRVFRTDFWNLDVGGFPDSAHAEPLAIVNATLRAQQFDFLQTVSCVRQTRLDFAKLLPDPLTTIELDSRLSWMWTAWRLLRNSTDPTVASCWLGGLIDGDFGDFAADAHRADASYRVSLHKAAQDCLALADETMWRQIRVDRKLRLWLVANGNWTDLERLLQHVALYGSIPETEVRDGRLYAVGKDLPGVALAPVECRELSESQTSLSACVERVAWHEDRLEVHGWAFIRGLDLTFQTPQLTASLIEPVAGLAYPCDVTQLNKVAANDWSMFGYQDVAA
ncbi:MAG TPA: glycosyltransferase family 2 protein, partial [Propionibacteriaceae bacterium]|nr:glycosyltransferase family 2 protein [Propionibacteriaceae bacterium]